MRGRKECETEFTLGFAIRTPTAFHKQYVFIANDHMLPFFLVRMDDIMRCDFALLNGDVDNLIRASAIACGINMRRGGLHLWIGNDASVFGHDAGFFQVEAGGVGTSTEREKNFLRMNAFGFSFVFK